MSIVVYKNTGTHTKCCVVFISAQRAGPYTYNLHKGDSRQVHHTVSFSMYLRFRIEVHVTPQTLSKVSWINCDTLVNEQKNHCSRTLYLS